MSKGVSSIGSCMSFSSTVTADRTQAQYAGLTAWTQSGEATNIGDVGPENEVITFNTVCDGVVNKRMGATNFGQQAIILAYDADNGAQAIVAAKALDKTPLAVRETLATGDILYYEAYVASLKTQVGGSSDFLRAAVTLEIDSPIIEVNAA